MREYCDLAKKLAKEVSEGRATKVHERTLSKSDMEGFKYILETKNVGAVFILPKSSFHFGIENTELFYELHDPEIQRLGREALIKEWFNGVCPSPKIGDVFRLTSSDHKYEGEAMACLVEPGRYSFIWTRVIYGNIKVGEYAMCNCKCSLPDLIKERGYLFCKIERISS